MKSNYIFRQQQGNRGYYVEITFEANVDDDLNNKLIITYLADPRWEIACKAGIVLFYDYYLRKIQKGLEVRVYEVKWIPIDTNNLIVLFGSVNALSQALNFPVQDLLFESDVQSFTFPDRRSL